MCLIIRRLDLIPRVHRMLASLLGRAAGALALAVLAVTAVWAQPPNDNVEEAKPPWKWTLEERLEARYDPEQIQQRRRAAIERLRAVGRLEEAQGLAANPPWYNPVSGTDHPELLMPTRLLDSLLNRAFYYDRRDRIGMRRSLASRSKALQPDEEFWRDLGILAAELLAMKHQVKMVFDQLDATVDPAERLKLGQRLKQVQKGRCRLIWSTLQACREHFGPRAFDRFLYEAVAAGVATGGATPGEESAAMELDAWLEHAKQTTRRFATGECPDDS